MKKWQIWIDTGGTFTDCIATAPNGEKERIKVLSSGRLRGVVVKIVDDYTIEISQQWQVTKDIFKGYQFLQLGNQNATTKIITFDPQKNWLVLDTPLSLASGDYFEITAHEEAPILATRIATQTPLHEMLPPLDIRLGSTKGTNALLERKGAEVTLLITKGFRDLLYIGTQQRPHLFQLDIPEPNLLYKKVIEVEERIGADGEVIKPLQLKTIDTIINQVETPAVAVALLHSYLNPIHEQQLLEALQTNGIQYCSLSSTLSPTIKILPRATTALVNAYLHPILDLYLSNIKAKLGTTANLKVMTSAGGLVDATFFHPKDSLLSGPAGGVVGAAAIAHSLGFENILTLDMGGTSTDTARYNGSFDYHFTTKVGDAEMSTPSLAIETVAAGGGSICSFDEHKLTVGPESAGANPGPASYGAGGPLTITDVNLLLGKLDPTAMGIPIQVELARQRLTEIQDRIYKTTGNHISSNELLKGFEQIANEKMAEAIRKISVAKGFDPKDYALLVFGGAGGLHACKIADLLQIKKIILPYDGGLLSAYGIGVANIQRMATKQVLQPFESVAAQLVDFINPLAKEVIAAISAEGYDIEVINLCRPLLYLRFVGQENSLEIEYSEHILSDFKSKYIQLFGHYPTDGIVELESIKVIAQTDVSSESKTVSNQKVIKKKIAAQKIYHWAQLPIGGVIEEECTLLNATSTAFIEKGWQLEVKANKNIVLTKLTDAPETVMNAQEAIELELFTNRFTAIAEEMGTQLQRTAFSVNIKERLDFSCALLDAQAELLVNAPHIPVHLGSLGICARLILEQFTLEEGDVIITNHPKYGGSHLPDVTLLSGVFTDQGGLIGYVINRAHHAEIGGKRPGSMPPDATTLVEEGVAIVPTYLVKKGEVQWITIKTLLTQAPYPTRSVTENIADINAALASLKTGQVKLKALVMTHGLSKVHHYMSHLKASAAIALQQAMRNRIGQSYSAIEKLDDGHTIQVLIECTAEQIHFDFSGTSPVHPNNFNANISIVYSAIMYVLRLLCQKEMPLNDGLMQQVAIHLPESFLNPSFSDDPYQCPAVVGGNTEVSQRLVDTLLKAFELSACSQGTMNNFLFGNASFGYYETICGGTGAGVGFHGRSAIHQHMTNTKITDPEELERRYPVQLNQFGIRKYSGGRGKWLGGDGIIRAVEFLEPVEVTILAQHRVTPPYGMKGGNAGELGKQQLIRSNGSKIELSGVDSVRCEIGDSIIIETPGGGGWGEEVRETV